MNYEIVHLEEKTVIGLIARTNNMAPDMGMVIGGLWEQFYKKGTYAAIQNKSNDKALGIYTDYAGTEKDDYNIIVACEVTDTKVIPQGTVKRTLTAGKYAKFIIKGDTHKVVAEFWQELWNMELPRSFICDFEEYQNSDLKNAEIHIYIGLKG